MSEYEGKIPYRGSHRRRGNVDLIDLLYYELSGGKVIPKELKEKIMADMEKKDIIYNEGTKKGLKEKLMAHTEKNDVFCKKETKNDTKNH